MSIALISLTHNIDSAKDKVHGAGPSQTPFSVTTSMATTIGGDCSAGTLTSGTLDTQSTRFVFIQGERDPLVDLRDCNALSCQRVVIEGDSHLDVLLAKHSVKIVLSHIKAAIE